MLIAQLYLILAEFSRSLFNSLVFDPNQAAPKSSEEKVAIWNQEFAVIYSGRGRTDFLRRLTKYINLTSDCLFIGGCLSCKFLNVWFGLSCCLLSVIVWMSVVHLRFDFTAKKISIGDIDNPDPSGIEFKPTGRADPTVASCTVCGEPLVGKIVFCKQCETPHHKDCWKYLGKCSVYACGGRFSRNQTRKEIITARNQQ